MSQSIETKDGRWVLVLSKEEAELLGTFRYKHVTMNCQLYNTLAALPFIELGEYRTELHAGKVIFQEFVPVCPEPEADVPTVRKCTVARPFARGYGITAAQLALTVRRIERQLLAVAPRRWFVQWMTPDAAGWCSLVSNQPHRPATGLYPSRNEAYRQLEARAIHSRQHESNYRVVPEGTPDGPEKDRGYYTVQFYVGGWAETNGGPGTGNRSVNGRYPAAKMANDDIREYGYEYTTYRVKWHPSNS